MTIVNEMVVPMLGDRFELALVMMYRLHLSQVRKGSPVPYVAHLLSVAALVLEDGGDEDEAIAALLHDAMEDQGLRRDVLCLRFGDRVCEIVEGCTESVVVPRRPWRERKLLHLAMVEGATVSVRRVTMADKLHNVRSFLAEYERLGPGLWGRFGGGRDGTIWYYREMVSRLQVGERSGMMQSLLACVERLEQLV
ncbi:MAG: HD domain-containing protein [Alkalinema sp. CAN_BIN05]|nr:HD domain-containing protein [Alkalinema sp. CAN_BIN05]